MQSTRQKSGDRSQKKERMEARLADIESQPGFRKMMRQSAADVKAGRVLTQAQLKKRLGKVE